MGAGGGELDVAIIGMAGRFPGANDIGSFWENLLKGKESITFFSDEELLQEGVDAALLQNPRYVKAASMLDNIDLFDEGFFGYSGREAARMDPQSRLFLECAWEALECSGYAPYDYQGPIGVYASQSMNTYLLHNVYPHINLDEFMLSYNNIQHVLTNLNDFLATRVSYKFNLTGPSINVQCACSSSLVAVHLACQSLINGECEMALAGGVSLYLPQKRGYLYEEGMILSPDGHCRAFDAEASGTMFGRGVGVVVLKPMEDAVHDGDMVFAVIKGSAINNDGGNKVGFTAPSIEGQAEVVAEALALAGVSAETISYIEAHGTGTTQGDPIEVAALTSVFRNYTKRNGFCALGTVKSNFGHLDAAAGIAGLIKTVLMLHNKKIPPLLHYKNPNPQIDFEQTPFYPCHKLQEWKTSGFLRRAGVSAFGMGGTNAHMVLEEAPEAERDRSNVDRPVHVLTLSAKSEKALRKLAERYEQHLEKRPEESLQDVCFTANVGRTHFEHRLAVVGRSLMQVQGQLGAFVRGDETSGVLNGTAKVKNRTGVAFLFTGQGSQYVGMGQELYESQPAFRKALDKCDNILREYLERPLLSVLYPQPGEESPLNETAYTQPALFALEYALYELWLSWGIEPAVVMGHSVGEYVAACVAEVFSLEDGLKLTAERGRLIQALPKNGGMAAVFAGEGLVTAAIAGYEGSVSIAAVNGPENTVISGERESLDNVLKKLEGEGLTAQPLIVSHPFHSPLMEPMLDAFEQAAKAVAYSSPRLGLLSNVTGRLVTGDEVSKAEYWRRHVRAPVQFYRSIQALKEQGEDIFLELGPHPVLLGMGAQCLPEGDLSVWLPSLRRGQSDWRQILDSLGDLYARGAKVSWKNFDRDYRRYRVSLPAYPFERRRHWIEPPNRKQITPVPSIQEDSNNCLYQMNWKQVPRLQESKRFRVPSDWIPSPSQICKSLMPEMNRLADQYDLDVYSRMAPQFNRLCIAYIVNAFQEMGFEFKMNLDFTAESLTRDLGITPRHYKLTRRFLEVLASAGFLAHEGQQWRVVKIPQKDDPAELWRVLSKEYAQCRHELGFLAQTGVHLAEIMSGKADPFDFLFPEGDLSTSEKLYQESPFARVFNSLAQKAVSAPLEGLPTGCKARIIEIGAGTGGTTSFILPHLPGERVEYYYTDISPLFLQKARKKFNDYPFVRYETFDVEKDPVSQGIDRYSFDIVIAANVIHATRDLTQSLGYIRELLAPGGLLVCLEVTGAQIFADVTVGLLDGWWRFSDYEVRPTYPLLSQRQWKTLMEKNGFSSAESIPEISRSEGDLSQQAVLLARADESPHETKGVGSMNSKPKRDQWVIFADRQGVGEKLAAKITTRNGQGALVFVGERYNRENGVFTIDPNSPDDMIRLFDELSKNRREPLSKIVHLWSLDVPSMEESTIEQFKDNERMVCGSALHLAQRLARSEDETTPTLLLVTRSSQSPKPDSETTSPQSSTLWGLGRVITREHPQVRCVCVDLGPSSQGRDDDDVEALIEEGWLSDGETQVSYYDGERYVARLAPYRLDKQNAQPERSGDAVFTSGRFPPDATYLITGGLGGLGLLFTRWMIGRGARHFILMGRNAPSPSAREALEDLEKTGAKLMIAQGDISSVKDITRILNDGEKSLPPLRGILHCAGVLEDAVLINQDWGRFEKVFAPKVFGGFNLHALTQDLRLDFFILFSSAASLLGLAGQGNHAAANAFLDSLARYRRSKGLPGISINWGPWSDVGAATKGNFIERIRSQGMETIAPEKGLMIFDQVLREAPPQVAVGRMNWPTFLMKAFADAVPPMFADVHQNSLQEEKRLEGGISPEPDFTKQLMEAPPSRRRNLLLAHVTEQVRKGLRLEEGKHVDSRQPLSELGLDSLFAIELRNHIGLSLGLKRLLPATLLFDYPTIDAITTYIEEEALSICSSTRPKGEEEEDTLLNEIESLSDAEAEALLLREISGEIEEG